MNAITQLSDDELRSELRQQYAHLEYFYPEQEAVKMLKTELYRRGYERTDVVQIALASLLQLQRRAN